MTDMIDFVTPSGHGYPPRILADFNPADNVRWFISLLQHPAGYDSDHAVACQDTFCQHIDAIQSGDRAERSIYWNYGAQRCPEYLREHYWRVIERIEGRRPVDPNGGVKLEPRSRCDSCAQYEPTSTFVQSWNGALLCPACVSRYYVLASTANGLGLVSRNDVVRLGERTGNLEPGNYQSEYLSSVLCFCRLNERYFADAEQHRASDCCSGRRYDAIYEYHGTTPINEHGWPKVTPRDSLCFGVELEMESSESPRDREYNEDTEEYEGGDAESLQYAICKALGLQNGVSHKDPDILGRYVLEQDGSLDDTGVELVTCPYTLDFHLHKFGWRKLLGRVSGIAKSGSGTTACGMHVHVNRTAISALTLGKMLVFVNAEGNTRLIKQVAQRDSDRWARRYEKSVKMGKDRDSDKYEALHVARETIEFRIFRGNLKPERVLKNIEFCHSVVLYCQGASMQELGTPNGYFKWLFKHRGTYKNLVKFLGLPHTRDDI